MEKGKLFGVGIGSGDPDFITLKAAKTIKNVDHVYVPRSSEKAKSLAESIANDLLADDRSIVELTFPMTKDHAILNENWKKAAIRIYDDLLTGKDVAFLTLGDPSLYSTFAYLSKSLRSIDSDVVIEVIPGISSPFACAAAAGVSLAEGDQRIAIIPMGDDGESVSRTIDDFDTTVILKIGKHLERLVKIIESKGLQGTSVIVKSVGLPEEVILRNIEVGKNIENVGYFSTAIIKKGIDRW